MLRPFLKTLTSDDKHYVLNRDNLTQTIQVQLSQKQETFSQFCFALLKSVLNLESIPKQHDPFCFASLPVNKSTTPSIWE